MRTREIVEAGHKIQIVLPDTVILKGEIKELLVRIHPHLQGLLEKARLAYELNRTGAYGLGALFTNRLLRSDSDRELVNPALYGFPETPANMGALVVPPRNAIATAMTTFAPQEGDQRGKDPKNPIKRELLAVAYCSSNGEFPGGADLAVLGRHSTNPLVLAFRPDDSTRVNYSSLRALDLGHSLR